MAYPNQKSRVEAAPQLGAEIVAGLRAGDASAFEHIYEAYRARLYSFLLRLTRDEALARDLAQESWLRLAANARRLPAATQPGAWLFTVARNLFLSQRRWANVHAKLLATLGAQATETHLPSPLEELAAGAQELRLERALAALPVHYREVVLLVAIESFSAAEVGTMLELEPTTVRKRLSRARALLQRALRDQDHEDGA